MNASNLPGSRRRLRFRAGKCLLHPGKITESEFLSTADSSDPHKNRVLHCQALYYIGIKHLFAKQNTAAKQCFAKCLAMGVALDESLYAKGELRTLDTLQKHFAASR